ncbi:MAG: hypothetical protein RXR08_13535 [Sulfolobaceae archaeon]
MDERVAVFHRRLLLFLTSSTPWKGEVSLPEGSSFPPSIRDYI